MINFWNSLAFVYLIIILVGIAWSIGDTDLTKNKSLTRLNIEIFCMNVIMIMLISSPIVFVMLLMFGKSASEGNMWGLIPI